VRSSNKLSILFVAVENDAIVHEVRVAQRRGRRISNVAHLVALFSAHIRV